MNGGIIVLGGHVQSLGILRILGREGIPGIIIDSTRKNIARHSKYCKQFFLAENEQILELLFKLAESGEYKNWVIFPSNDFHVQMLSQNKAALEENFIVSTDQWDAIKIFYNKTSTYKLAEELGIPIAKTCYPSDETSLDAIEVEYPCIIKPAVMHDFYRQTKKKVFVCNDLADLKENYRQALLLIPSNEIIIQEIIQGPSKNQFSACFLFLQGKTYISLTACRMRQHPLDFGNATTYAETVDIPELKEYGEKILKAANYNGVCEVEFKLDARDNQLKFLEVNTRTWKWHTIANKAETPFLKNFYDHLTGKTITPVKGFKKAAFFHLLTDFPIRLKLLMSGHSYWKRKIAPIEHAVYAADDVSPWIWEKIYLPFLILSR